MTAPQILSYQPTGPLGALPIAGVLPDFVRNQIYFVTPGTGGTTSGVHQFDGYATGNETLTKSINQLKIPEIHANGATLTLAGYMTGNQFGSNSTTLWETYAPTGAFINEFGIASSSLSASTSSRILCPGSQARLRYGGTEFIISTPLDSGFGEVCLLTIPGLKNVNLGALTENRGYCGPGQVGTTQGTGYVIGIGGTTNLGLYKVIVSASGGTLTRIASITPASIDATWTHITSASGCAFDQTDSCPIIQCTTTDSVTNKNYLVKLDGTSGAVIWACPINSTLDSASMASALITKQIFYYMGASDTLYTINTATGAATTQTIGSYTAGAQVSEDLYGSIVYYGSWAQTTTTPTYIGTYMGTGGNHTVSNSWFRFFPAPPSPAPPTPSLPALGVVSTNRAWTYVQDGHTFYVLDLGTQGTFAFDTVTSQWCELQTNGSNFAMLNGIMWGQRVVGGDPATTDVWELDPGATTDSGGAYQIDHVSTGGISTRSRTFVSCDAVRISASFGELDEGGTVTFNLRFSDDQEETWSPYYTVTMTEGAFDAEIAWRSLGSFNAPGRIFELSDSGGLIRIDGCDAFLNGFDNDTQDQDASEK